jgi:hypothetical protein
MHHFCQTVDLIHETALNMFATSVFDMPEWIDFSQISNATFMKLFDQIQFCSVVGCCLMQKPNVADWYSDNILNFYFEGV